jgi:hypothetical protein
LGADFSVEPIWTALNGCRPHRFDLAKSRFRRSSPFAVFIHTEEVTGSIPVSPTQVTGSVRNLRAGPSPLYSRKVQLRPHPASASVASAGVCRGCGGAGPPARMVPTRERAMRPAGGADPVAWGPCTSTTRWSPSPAHRTLLRTRRAPVQCPWQPGRGHVTTRQRSNPPTGADRSLRAPKAMPTIPRSILPSTTRSFTGTSRAR